MNMTTSILGDVRTSQRNGRCQGRTYERDARGHKAMAPSAIEARAEIMTLRKDKVAILRIERREEQSKTRLYSIISYYLLPL